jgi:hypothetical protein
MIDDLARFLCSTILLDEAGEDWGRPVVKTA